MKNEDFQNEAKSLRKEMNRLQKAISLAGWKTLEGRKLMQEEIEIRRIFMEKHGEENLLAAILGKASSFGRNLNSRGNGYGNL